MGTGFPADRKGEALWKEVVMSDSKEHEVGDGPGFCEYSDGGELGSPLTIDSRLRIHERRADTRSGRKEVVDATPFLAVGDGATGVERAVSYVAGWRTF